MGTFVTSSHVAATAAIHVITKSLPSYGKSLKKEKHQKIDQIQPCQVQSLARLHALTVATMMHVVQMNKNIVMNAAQRLTKNKTRNRNKKETNVHLILNVVKVLSVKVNFHFPNLTCVKKEGKCKKHQEFCGCLTTYPPICHGDCCGTLTCEHYGLVGGAGTCVNKEEATPRECCKKAGVPEFCLGLCSPADAMARQGKRINACSKYDSIIEGCFQAFEPSVQETSDESDEDGPTISHGSPTIVQPQGKQESPRGIEIQKQGRTLEKKSDVCKNHGEPCGYTRGVHFPEYVGACCGGLRCDQNPKSSDGLPLVGGAGKCVKKSQMQSRPHPVC